MNTEIKSIKELLNIIKSSSAKVFIVGHNNPDLDSLASAIGLQTLCEYLGKEAYIVVNESETTIEPIAKKVRDANVSAHNIIDLAGFECLMDDDSTLIVTDTNKRENVAVKEYLDAFQNIIIIDHHNPGPTTIQNASTYIPIIPEQEQSKTDPKVRVSSASEIVAQLLLQADVKCDKDVYTYLYGGIYLDTNRFDKNVGESTHKITHKLCSRGADTTAVKELFLADFDEDKVISNLVFNGTIMKAYAFDAFNNYTIAFTLNREQPNTIYRRETIAKSADKMMQYRIEGAFAMGYIDERTIAVSARSRGRIDVRKIMECIGGGGNSQNAATQLDGIPITAIEDILSVIITDKGLMVDGEVITPVESAVISEPIQYIKK